MPDLRISLLNLDRPPFGAPITSGAEAFLAASAPIEFGVALRASFDAVEALRREEAAASGFGGAKLITGETYAGNALDAFRSGDGRGAVEAGTLAC
jgi:hypothetical protein